MEDSINAPIDGLGESEAYLEFQTRLSEVAPIDRPVLIIGERGTGKELAARRLHYLSRRWGNTLTTVNCGALTPSLVESELFGYEAGAFTGANRRRTGRFEDADGGTLFLDEISHLPLEAQAKVLRVIEYGIFERVGGTEPVSIDIRIVGATNADLPKMAATGRFLPDLLDRLAFEVVNLPPLRERKEDISLLAHHFAAKMAGEMGWSGIPEFAENVYLTLESHAWPGNIRELKNVIERSVCRSRGELIDTVALDPFETPWQALQVSSQSASKVVAQDAVSETKQSASLELKSAQQALELDYLKQALARAQYNQKETAALMGLTYHQFRNLYRKHQAVLGSR